MQRAEPPEASNVGLSVVVIGRNEGSRLERCLRSVACIDDPSFPVEVIYVDSASTDDSVSLAGRMGVRTVEVRPSRPTAALGRNAGWKLASAPFVLFLDGDTILHPHFVRDAMPGFRDDEIAIIWGNRREIDIRRSVYNRVLDLDWIYPPGIVDFCGGDALVRRSVLEQVNGFDENLIAGEEPEMCRRIRANGYKILHLDIPMTGHDLAMTSPKQYWKRATRAGYAYAEVSNRFHGSGLPFWEDVARANRTRAVTLLLIPVLSVGLALIVARSWPLFLAPALLLLLVVRSAWKSGRKSRNFLTRVLYGFHSHVQQIPILWGQAQFAIDRKHGRRRGLIEYKNVTR